MTMRHTLRVCLAAAVAASCGFGTVTAAPPIPVHGGGGIEVLTRGPVHEAFAGTVTFDPQPGIVVPGVPPAAIEELPPEHKPEGDHVAWIPGYWAWDDDDSDFLWVSGTWRALPPGRQWVSGYWARSRQGAQWTSGYWADARLTEVDYLPEPPESVETGPNIAAPSADHIWLPGGWVWQHNRYAWRPGFWSVAQPNWVWVPAHYLWAPRGYVYVDGYWDYAIDRRGVLFAPVSFHQSVYSRAGFSYTPATVIDLGVFVNHLFLRPNYGHYYYGDYYGVNYATAGFFSWSSFHSGRRGYDPIYAYQRWNHRQDRDWERRVQSDFQRRRDNEGTRPPRTFTAQQRLAEDSLTKQDAGRVFAQPLDQFRQKKDGPMRFQSINNDDRQRFGRMGQEVRKHRDERQKREAEATAPTAERPARVALPRSPYVARESDARGKDFTPPKMHVLPQPDPGVVPKSRPSVRQAQPRQREPETVRPTFEPKSAPQAKPKSAPQAKPKSAPTPKPKVEPSPKPSKADVPKKSKGDTPKSSKDRPKDKPKS
jgi:hypothetical protein